MAMIEEAFGELKKKLEKTPGLGYVVILASGILGIVLKSVTPESSWWLTPLAIFVSALAYWVGGFLDDLLFEPIYGLPPKKERSNAFCRFIIRPIRLFAQRRPLAAQMIKDRARAANRFHPTNQRGIYQTAKKLLSNTERWDGQIKLWLDLSKASRTLIIPAVVLLAWELLAAIMHWPSPGLPDKSGKIAWLAHPAWTGSIAVISIVIYVHLRLRHMQLLYERVADTPAFRFVVRVLEPKTGSGLFEVLWSFGDRVISENELLVCQTPPDAEATAVCEARHVISKKP